MLTLLAFLAVAVATDGYQDPSADIAAILDAPRSPSIQFSPDDKRMLELERPALRPLSELAQEMVPIAGLKVDPATNGPSRDAYWSGLAVRDTGRHDRVDRTDVQIPTGTRITGLSWAADSAHFTLELTAADGIGLWVVDAATGAASELMGPTLNGAYGSPCDWVDHTSLVCKVIPGDRGPAPEKSVVPAGPMITESLGRKAPARTYTNLLQNEHDEALFEHYLTSELVRVYLDGRTEKVVDAALISGVSPSPDGRYVTVYTLAGDWSYTVGVSRFGRVVQVHDLEGGDPVTVAELPLADDVPIHFSSTRTGRRSIGWRADTPHTLYMVEALDGGDGAAEAEFRDSVHLLQAPFTGEPELLWKSELRYGGIYWGDGQTALVSESWRDDRRTRTWLIDPSGGAEPRVIWDRSYQDRYSDPGSPVTHDNDYGRRVLLFPEPGKLLLRGGGYSKRGVYPFLDRFDLSSGDSTRLWEAEDPYHETITAILDDVGVEVVTRRQSNDDPANYLLRTVGKKKAVALTDFQDPAPQFADVHREVIKYERADGLELSATLYLPPGYNKKRDGPLPTVFWAYPSEFKKRSDAAQITTSSNTFSRPRGSSVLMMLLEGYAVVNDPKIPIIGEGEAEPNDDYVEQLVSGAQAAVDAVVEMGVADPDRLVIGGHSYGAFTVANLLAHTDIFKAGIARSGAYNRSLTPFGFQGEQRSYWEATDTYMTMSPFTHAAKIDEPMLMIHGEKDPNSGTYPMQSARMFSALKGLGGTVRWVQLPLEEHGYRARESVGHTLWEMIRWADEYAK